MWGFQTFGNSSFVDCGGLKENRPHRLIYSDACSPVSEIVWEGLEGVRRCGVVGEGTALFGGSV